MDNPLISIDIHWKWAILHGRSAIRQASDSPPSRRRQGVRLRIEQEAAERLALGWAWPGLVEVGGVLGETW